MSTLRERSRRATREAIEDAALHLFRERGYLQVTIEDIAAAAGVSASTFYRYFGTKEGIFTASDLDVTTLVDEVDLTDVAGSLTRLAGQAQWKGMDLVLSEPHVRAAVLGWLDAFSMQLAKRLRSGGMSGVQASATARTICFGVYLSAIEQWHREGEQKPVGEYFAQAACVDFPTAKRKI